MSPRCRRSPPPPACSRRRASWCCCAPRRSSWPPRSWAACCRCASAPRASCSRFRYSFILWATLFDVALFGDWPDPWTLLGACIVVGCGVASLSREQRRQGGAAAAAAQHATRESSPPLVEVDDVACDELSEEEPRSRDSVEASLVDSGKGCR